MNKAGFIFFLLPLYLVGCGGTDPFPTFLAAFSAPKNISNPQSTALCPVKPDCNPKQAIAVDEAGNINVVWEEGGEIFFSRSIDDGATFSAGQNVSNTPLANGFGFSATPAIAVYGSGNIYVVWEEDFLVMFLRSIDGGKSFSIPVPISDPPPFGFSSSLALTVDGTGKIHIVYEQDFDIIYRQSTNDGIAFSFPQNLSNTPQTDITGFSDTPAISVDGSGNINVVWEEDLVIMFIQATSGLSVSAVQTLSDPAGISVTPSVAADRSGNINVVWEEDTDSVGEIFFSRSTDDGVTFPAGQNITNTVGFSATPAIAVDGSGNINVVWEEDFVIAFRRSFTGGDLFSEIQIISDPSAVSTRPAIVVGGSGVVHAVWQDGDPLVGNTEIFFVEGR